MKEKIVKINKTKSWFFEKINKTEEPLARLIKKKRRIKSTKLDNEEIQRTIRDYYEQLYGNKMDNLEEKDRFLEVSYLPLTTQLQTLKLKL